MSSHFSDHEKFLMIVDLEDDGKPYPVFHYGYRGGGYVRKDRALQLEQVLQNTLELSDEDKDRLEAEARYWARNASIEIQRKEAEAASKSPKLSKKTFIYLMRNKRNGYYKIGHSSNPSYREKTLQSEEPEVELEWYIQGTTDDEKYLHEEYANKHIRGEWFSLSERDVLTIKALLGGVTRESI